MGIVTPTGSGCLCCILCAVGRHVHVQIIKVSDLPEVFMRSMRDSSIVLILIAVVSVANWLLARSRRVPRHQPTGA
ncbi:hypothetical protein OK016_28260 [Vibrio chagasii]|nr:hypothetical protein [Vibrio chagasii]